MQSVKKNVEEFSLLQQPYGQICSPRTHQPVFFFTDGKTPGHYTGSLQATLRQNFIKSLEPNFRK